MPKPSSTSPGRWRTPQEAAARRVAAEEPRLHPPDAEPGRVYGTLSASGGESAALALATPLKGIFVQALLSCHIC